MYIDICKQKMNHCNGIIIILHLFFLFHLVLLFDTKTESQKEMINMHKCYYIATAKHTMDLHVNPSVITKKLQICTLHVAYSLIGQVLLIVICLE